MAHTPLPAVKSVECDARSNVHLWMTNEEWRYNYAHECVMKWDIDRAAGHLESSWKGERTGDGIAYLRNRIKYALICDFENTYDNAVCAVRKFFKDPENKKFADMRRNTHCGKIWTALKEAGLTHAGKVPFSQKNIRDALAKFDSN